MRRGPVDRTDGYVVGVVGPADGRTGTPCLDVAGKQ